MSGAKPTQMLWLAVTRRSRGFDRHWIVRSGERVGHFPSLAAAQAEADKLNAAISVQRRRAGLTVDQAGMVRSHFDIAKATGSPQ